MRSAVRELLKMRHAGDRVFIRVSLPRAKRVGVLSRWMRGVGARLRQLAMNGLKLLIDFSN